MGLAYTIGYYLLSDKCIHSIYDDDDVCVRVLYDVICVVAPMDYFENTTTMTDYINRRNSVKKNENRIRCR